MLSAGIVGLPNVGKSTLFNAVTQTRKAMAANLCRCGTHNRIVRAIQRAAKAMAATPGRSAAIAEGAQA